MIRLVKSFGVLFAGSMLVLCIGCQTVNLVRAKVEVNRDIVSKPDVYWAPRREHKLPTEAAFVVHAPEPETVSIYHIGDGEAAATERIAVESTQAVHSNEGDLLSRDASVWISEIERQLMRNGYRVLSRQQYHTLLREQKAANKETAASALGANYIIQINALEYRQDLLDGTSLNVVLQHYTTDPDGANPQPVVIKESRERAQNKPSTPIPASTKRADTVIRVIRKNYLPAFCSVFLDAKVIEVKTGEVINSYRVRQDLVLQNKSEFDFYFRPGFTREQGLFDPATRLSRQTESAEHSATIRTGRLGGRRDSLLDYAVRTVCSEYISSLTGK